MASNASKCERAEVNGKVMQVSVSVSDTSLGRARPHVQAGGQGSPNKLLTDDDDGESGRDDKDGAKAWKAVGPSAADVELHPRLVVGAGRVYYQLSEQLAGRPCCDRPDDAAHVEKPAAASRVVQVLVNERTASAEDDVGCAAEDGRVPVKLDWWCGTERRAATRGWLAIGHPRAAGVSRGWSVSQLRGRTRTLRPSQQR
jgi:hypothetical protein